MNESRIFREASVIDSRIVVSRMGMRGVEVSLTVNV